MLLCAENVPLTSGIASCAAPVSLPQQVIICCVEQVYKYMSERGLAHGGLSDYYNTWYMFADRQGSLLISEAIPWSQRSDPTCLSATEVSLQYLSACTYCPASAY